MESIRERGSLEQQVFQGRTLTVYTPPSYGLADKRYPVVYVNDPSDYMDSVTNQAVTRMEELFREKKLPELILVGLEPDERLDEYTPWPAKALVESVQDFGGYGKNTWISSFMSSSLISTAATRRWRDLPGRG